MKRWLGIGVAMGLAALGGAAQAANWQDLGNPKVGPQQTLKQFHDYFKSRFPSIPLQKYADGPYIFNKDLMQQYQEAVQFNPGEITLEEGKKLWDAPFRNGKTYASCYPDGGKGVATRYPYYDPKLQTVVTLGGSLNACREHNGERPLQYGGAKMAALQTYLASLSNGLPVDVKVQGPGAIHAFEQGKAFYFMKRGPHGFSCAACHVAQAGMSLHNHQTISATLGEAAHFPAYGVGGSAVKTLQKQFADCETKLGVKPHPLESTDYRDLEYFVTYLSNGIRINAPGYQP